MILWLLMSKDSHSFQFSIFLIQGNLDYWDIINKYYGSDEDAPLRKILVRHSTDVANMALEILKRHPELNLDARFVEEAAMLHDIGIVKCDAPGISCLGAEPYLCHGRLGADMLRNEGYPDHARVCERHTGAGIGVAEIMSRNLPLPHQNFLPETMAEKLICYADKFYSKSHLDHTKTVDEAEHSVAKFSDEGLKRFKEWEKIFR